MMNQTEETKFREQIDQWNDADEFSRCIEAIEAIPEQERDYLLTVKLSRAYSNLAVLSDRGALGENAEVDGDLLRHAIDLLESVRTQGENDPYWNARMGYSCLMAYSSAAIAYEYAKRWLALAPDDPAAQKLVRDCEEYLEEEKRLLGINVKELAELNDNVYGLRTDLTALVDLLGKYKLSITQDTQDQAVKFGNTVLGRFIDQIEIKCTEAEQRIAQMDNRIYLSYKAFYILIVILITLSSFLICMIVANVEFLHSWLIWRMVAACGLIAILGITMVIVVHKLLGNKT